MLQVRLSNDRTKRKITAVLQGRGAPGRSHHGMNVVSPDADPVPRAAYSPSGDIARPSWLRSVLGFCAFEIAFYFAYRYGMSFGHSTSSPFWFPDSVLLCALLLVRPSWWWLFLLSTLPIRFLVEVPPGTPATFLLAVFSVDCAKAVIAALLLRRFLTDPIRFKTVRDLGVYALVAVLCLPAISAFAGAAARQSLGHEYWQSWEQWFYGNALAGLIVTPVLFYWVLRPPRLRQMTRGRRIEALSLAVGLLLTTSLAFEAESGEVSFSDTRFYAPVAFLFWAAVRFGMAGASAAIALLTSFAVATAQSGSGPFVGHSPAEVATSLQHYLLLRAAPLYLVAVLIEHAKRVERSLRESERRFRHAADNAPVLIGMSGVDSQCDFFNKGWLDFTGRPLEQEIGLGWLTCVHPLDRERCLATYQTSFHARRPFEIEYRLRRHDAQYRWILQTAVPRYDTGGRFLGYIGSAIDVTVRRMQEAALRESEERYRDLVESQTDFVCRFLPDTTLTFVNEAYCGFCARERQDLLGTKLLELMPEKSRELIASSVSAAASSNEPCSWECEVPHQDGSPAWQRWTCHAILDSEGRLLEFQAVGHDNTDRELAEQANRKLAHASRLAALGELTAMIGHQINQPLTAILINAEAAEMMLNSADPPLAEIRQILGDICDDDLRADAVIRGVRALTQQRELHPQPVDLNRTITDVLRLTAGDALCRHVQIVGDLQPDLPPVFADRVSLEQVILNLIINGMDAMKDNSEATRQLTVSTRLTELHGAEVSVMDSGHGIPADSLPRLFDSFYTTKTEGTGLGLSIARTIIAAHQGRLWAENRPEGGAIFRFTVPSALADAAAATGSVL